jgi:hypothetical protein
VGKMKLLIVIGTLLIPAALALLRRMSVSARLVLDALGVVSAFGFGILSAFAVSDIRRHDTVYSTEVHWLFDSLWFLAFGGYLGLYLLALLLGGFTGRFAKERRPRMD